jgi:hypothetical protein
MQCHLKRLMLVCATLSLSSCAHAPPPTDSFCQIYNRVVVQKGDGAITATAGVKKRILANELTYRDQCVPKK